MASRVEAVRVVSCGMVCRIQHCEAHRPCFKGARLDKWAQGTMQQTVGRADSTEVSTLRLLVQPIKTQPMPSLHSTDAQMVQEDDVMSCR
jgi:hypothetical protein